MAKEVAPRSDAKRKLESADWETLSLVDDNEVEERMNYVRLGQLISHECESQLRELAAYMGALLGTRPGRRRAQPAARRDRRRRA